MTTDRFLFLDEAASTNSYLMEMLQQDRNLPQLFAVVARNQTHGRGQRGNSWYTSANKNLTFSFLIRNGYIAPQDQYAVSELVAYGLLKTIARYLDEDQAYKLKIKWPNDIYYEDKKIAGILIEHSITGEHIDYSVAGIGLNLNEESFPADIPNPISLKQITGESYDPDEVLRRLMKRYGFMIEEFLLGNYAEVHREYMRRLYRRRGLHPFTDAQGHFLASIKDVLPTGQIVLQREDGAESTYAFKEIQFDAE
ncbi:biotin--[acetyl-CoA-carboxylase] ligase [Porphyromonas sp. COT-290 OH860]|uniref:biotin--[acetyl-CoA-carboxylase] ligase n=1 Tax=Porphyromonas sp. COT-290 OH860 TaxID=1515615 RepID=UPI00052CE2CF|nr:biotin--[acetyl-CoA-carboxylase] ligase [Porphyromonas sp. COT-290 OH860]KGN85027.1 biotin--acetyl-CoA-carboxylase ligase [Porphyromonas sp. COT-290 OH860]